MIVVVTIEQRFDRTPDKQIWSSMFSHSFWRRYLAVFDGVRVVARVRNVQTVPPNSERADVERISFAPVPYYIGPWQYVARSWHVRRAARRAIGPADAVILRVDSQIAACLYPLLRRTYRPYGVEVVVDPYDVFAPGSFNHPLRPLFRWKFVHQLKRQCGGSAAAAYVTKHALQCRYPPAPNAFTTHYSSVELPDSAFATSPRPAVGKARTFKIITVAAMEDLRKGHDVLIDATARCLRGGLDIQLILVGDGRNRSSLEARAAQLALEDRVRFCGQLNPDAARAQLDQADLFVLPSRGEGLPRAMVEAMARGLPAIGSTIGGFPELLLQEDLVPPGDPVRLASKISEVLASPERMARMSARNLEAAREYREEILRERRTAFYRYLRERTQAWLNGL